MWATGDLLPDLTIVLDVNPEVGLARLSNRDRLEAEPLLYHQRVRNAFLLIAADEPDRYLVLDATLGVAVLAAAILERVLAELDGR
jgi:dTMP kinase